MAKANAKPDTNFIGDPKGKDEWNRRLGAGYVQARNWRLVALLSIGVALMSTSALMTLVGKSNIETIFVKVNGDSNEVMGTELVERGAAVDPLVVMGEVAEWVRRARVISLDGAVMKTNLDWVYQRVNGEVEGLLSEFYRDPINDPRERAKRERVSVEVISRIWLSKDTAQIDWLEKRFDRTGKEIDRGETWRGLLTVKLTPPTSKEAALVNPMGLAIVHFDWNQVR